MCLGLLFRFVENPPKSISIVWKHIGCTILVVACGLATTTMIQFIIERLKVNNK
jgi:hypothetical protein